ncbi:MAG: DNA polymerase I, partial [Candidatus Magasanikbacteria bacterium]|nr:DNA polymerase I [Candidatus Magasanikbacteria bacterium]
MDQKKFVIIDGNAIIHRAYHALPPMTVKGTMVNAVYGFTSMLLKVIKDLKPDYLAVSFDVAGGTFRDKVFDGYKAKRVKADQELYDQIPLVHKVVSAFGLPILKKEGFEADDVIATVIAKIQDTRYKIQTVIVSGDMDLLQLVDDNVSVYALRKGMSDIVMYDAEEVKKKYGFGPEHVVDYKSLRGDQSDNIPGVPGIGEKTATELIQKVGGIEEIYEQVHKVGKSIKSIKSVSDGVLKKLVAGEESARMSQKLATVVKDVPGLNFNWEDCAMKDFDRQSVVDLLRKFEFFSLIKRLPGGDETSPSPSPARRGDKSDLTSKNSELIEIDEKNIGELEKAINGADVFGCKEILSGTDILNSELLGLVFVVGDKSFRFKNPQQSVGSVFCQKGKTLVGHNLKQLVKVLTHLHTYTLTHLFDTMIASYLLNSSTRAHDAKSVILRELGQEIQSGSDQGSLFGSNPKQVAEELRLIMQAHEIQKKKLAEMEDFGLFEKVEMKLIPILAEMELNGVAIDSGVLKKLSKDVGGEINKIDKQIQKEAGEEFNVASPTQLRDILFDKLKLPSEGVKKGKTGYSTADAELEKLIDTHPIISLIRDYRELAKLQNTYVDVLPTLVNKTTGRIHTTFNQAVTTTGRLSSSEPNLQNIPIRTDLGKEIRNAFIAEAGNNLIAADYSQIELRIVASLAKDETMIEVFKRGEDIHQATAAVINDVPLEKVTKEMRYAAKAVNFGVLYGMGSYGLAWRTKMQQWQAKDVIKKYFAKFSSVKKYIDQTLEFAKKEGYVETLFGRRRYIPELKSDNFQLHSA